MARIMIVDDDEKYADAVKENLEGEGHKVVVCGDTVSARENLTRYKPEAILLDCEMEGIPSAGPEFARKLKGENYSGPILSYSTLESLPESVDVTDLEEVEFISKRNGSSAVISKLEAMLAVRQYQKG